MKEFLYIAKDPDARTKSGDLFAWDLKHAVKLLHGQGFTVIDIRPVRRRGLLFYLTEGSRGRTIALFVRQLATLLKAGIPLLRALHSISDIPDRFMQKIMRLITSHVTTGYSLSEALKIHSDIFPSHLVATIRVGEIGGTLPENLENLAEYIEKDYQLRMRIKAAMTYPAVITSVCFFMVFFIFAFILPQFEGFFSEVDMDFPPITQFMMNFVIVLRTQLVKLVLVFLVIAATLSYTARFVRQDPRMRLRFDAQVLRIPLWGALKKKFFFTWFFRSVGSMLVSGAALSHCLDVLGRAEGNGVFSKAILDTRASLVGGWTLGRSIRNTRCFPLMVSNMVAVGEQTGKLDIMFLKLADYYQGEVEYTIGNLSKLVEPALLGILGIGVAFILLGAFMPIYQLAGVTSGGMKVSQNRYAARRGSPGGEEMRVPDVDETPVLALTMRNEYLEAQASTPMPEASRARRGATTRVKLSPGKVAAAAAKKSAAKLFGKVAPFTAGTSVSLTPQGGGKPRISKVDGNGAFSFDNLKIREKYVLVYENRRERLMWKFIVEIPRKGEYEAILDEKNAQRLVASDETSSSEAGAPRYSTLAGRAELFEPGEKVTLMDGRGRSAVCPIDGQGRFHFKGLSAKTAYIIMYEHGDRAWRLQMELPETGDYEALLTGANSSPRDAPLPAEHPLKKFNNSTPPDAGGHHPLEGRPR